MPQREFKNEVVEGITVLTLSGPVSKPFPWEDPSETINEKAITEVLSNADGDILIKLNSLGGDVFEGISICNYLKSLPNQVTVEVTGTAASAASVICMGADKVVMDVGSTMMIHEASTLAYGNKSDIKKVLNALETIDASLVDIYVDKSGMTAEEINALLVGETWLTADEAVGMGLADEVNRVVVEETEAELDESNVNKVNDEIAMDPDFIKKMYAKVIEAEEQKQKLLKNFLGGI